MIALTSQTTINCSSSADSTIQWYIYRVNNVTGNPTSQIVIDPSVNPTVNYANLVIQPGSLSYGLYMFVYSVTMNFNSIYTNQVATYIQVNPSGILVSSLYGSPAGGIYETSRGTGQSIQLNPVQYSSDIDALVQMKNLNFYFYCQVINNGAPYGYPQISYGVNLDLLTMQKNYSTNSIINSFVNANNIQSCFSSISN